MATVKLWTDAEAEAHPKVKAVFDDIRATRKSDFVNNFWRGLANQPEILERTWNTLKAVMGAPGPLDPLTRELIYIAVSITNGCSYCISAHGRSASTTARALGKRRPGSFAIMRWMMSAKSIGRSGRRCGNGGGSGH